MRLVARKHESSWVVVADHVVERVIYGHAAAELRYAVRSPDGRRGTLVTSLHAYGDRRERWRFRRLAARRAALAHPAAIPVRAVGEHANHPVMITDPYPERTLGDLLRTEAPLAPERVVTMLAPVADALDSAHSRGLMHDALSGDSLLVVGHDRLMLDSFGLLASADEAAWSIIEASDIRYRSPEQVRGEPLGPPSNVYSLAALIVHALTGEPPYRGDRAAVMYAHLAERPPSVSERVPGLGREIDTVVAHGLAKEPHDRPSSTIELVRQTADALKVRRSHRAPASPVRPRRKLMPDGGGSISAVPSPRRARWTVSAAIGLAVAAGSVAAVVAAPFGEDGPTAAPSPAGAAAWEQLGPKRAELRSELASANTPQDQARAASALADAYERAAQTGRPAALAAAASDAGVAYARLAAAADSDDRPGYGAAARAVASAETRLAAAALRR